MDATIVAATIAASAAIVVPTIGSFLSKQKERGDDLRKERLGHYREFVRSLSGVRAGEDTDEGHRAYMLASNNLNLVAPQRVLDALHAYRDETSTQNHNRDYSREDQLLKALFLEIRKDLNVKPADDAVTSNFVLWTSGRGRPPENRMAQS